MTSNEYMKKIKDNLDSVNSNLKKISVNPQEPKTGHWIVHEIENTLKWLECSNCHCETSYKRMYNYCPDCGAKMFEPQESEEQE